MLEEIFFLSVLVVMLCRFFWNFFLVGLDTSGNGWISCWESLWTSSSTFSLTRISLSWVTVLTGSTLSSSLAGISSAWTSVLPSVVIDSSIGASAGSTCETLSGTDDRTGEEWCDGLGSTLEAWWRLGVGTNTPSEYELYWEWIDKTGSVDFSITTSGT